MISISTEYMRVLTRIIATEAFDSPNPSNEPRVKVDIKAGTAAATAGNSKLEHNEDETDKHRLL